MRSCTEPDGGAYPYVNRQRAGSEIRIDSVRPLDFSPNGEPGIGTYDVLIYGADMATENLEQIQGSL